MPEGFDFRHFSNVDSLRAAEALAAVQALVTGAVAHGDVAAVWTGRRILLEVRDSVTNGADLALGMDGPAVAMAIAVSVPIAVFHIKHLGIFGEGELGHRTIHPFFQLLNQTWDSQF